MKERRRKKYGNAGTTLVETLAAFTVLTAVLAIFIHIVDFSGRLRTQAVDSAHLNQLFLREAYKNDEAMDRSFVKIGYYGDEADPDAEDHTTTRFWLVLDTEKTDIAANYRGVTIEDEALFKSAPPRFRLDNMSAASYTCIDGIIEEEQLMAPSIMRFEYVPPVTEP
ncbi:MAG: hypothetical protein IKI75_06285 [Lachnospiraceae bacterium]|nr:hypothetical protein [Lachnospiraceae bacterium]